MSHAATEASLEAQKSSLSSEVRLDSLEATPPPAPDPLISEARMTEQDRPPFFFLSVPTI